MKCVNVGHIVHLNAKKTEAMNCIKQLIIQHFVLWPTFMIVRRHRHRRKSFASDFIMEKHTKNSSFVHNVRINGKFMKFQIKN